MLKKLMKIPMFHKFDPQKTFNRIKVTNDLKSDYVKNECSLLNEK